MDRLRSIYFRKALEKDSAYYDKHDPTRMTSKIKSEMEALTDVGHINGGKINAQVGFVICLLFSFLSGWLITTIIVGGILVIGLFLIVFDKLGSKAQLNEMKSYS